MSKTVVYDDDNIVPIAITVTHEPITALEESEFTEDIYAAIMRGEITAEDGIAMMNRENDLQDGSLWG